MTAVGKPVSVSDMAEVSRDRSRTPPAGTRRQKSSQPTTPTKIRYNMDGFREIMQKLQGGANDDVGKGDVDWEHVPPPRRDIHGERTTRQRLGGKLRVAAFQPSPAQLRLNQIR